jgi:tetratricopeptide (TPR) repeat protein
VSEELILAKSTGRGRPEKAARGKNRAEPLRIPTSLQRAAVIVAVATVLAYAPAVSAPFVMDDIPAIVENASVRRFVPSEAVPGDNLPAGNPVAGRPVVNLSLALNYALNHALGVDQRPDPDGPRKTIVYHLFNILAHLMTGGLLFGVIRRAIRERTVADEWRARADVVAAAVCAVWLLHPIQTEAVDYVVQRTELLASLFYVGTLYASIRAWGAARSSARYGWYAAGVLSCVLGIGCKEIAVSAPLAVMLYDRAFRLDSWSSLRRPGDGRAWFYLLLILAALLAFALIAAGGRGKTAGFAAAIPWDRYLYTQCWAIARYLRLVAWPGALTIDYGTRLVSGARGIPGAVLLAAFGVATLFAWTRVPKFGWFAFLGSWFFMLLAPSSSVVPIATEIAAERRIYLALAAVLVLLAVAVEWIRRRYAAGLTPRMYGVGVAGVALALATTTAARSATYADAERLWRDATMKAPNNPRAFVNLGAALMRQRPPKYAEAESLFRHAMAQDSTCHAGCIPLANSYAAQGRYAEAVPLLERALRFEPDYAKLERSLALMLMKSGSFDLAATHLAHVVTSFPSERNLVVLAVVYYALHRQRDAINAFDTASRLYPENAEIRRLAGTLYAASRTPDAESHLKELALTLAKDWE